MIGKDATVEIEGKIYKINSDTQFELKNNIVLDIVSDFSKISYQNLYANRNLIKGNYKIIGYYDSSSNGDNDGNYYLPINYSGTQIEAGEAVLVVKGENFETVSANLSNNGTKYYLFANIQ